MPGIENACFIQGRNPSVERPAQMHIYNITIPAAQLAGSGVRYCFFDTFRPGIIGLGSHVAVVSPANTGTSLDVDLQTWVWDHQNKTEVATTAINWTANINGLAIVSNAGDIIGSAGTQLYAKVANGPASVSVGERWSDPYGGALVLGITPVGTDSTEDLKLVVGVELARVDFGGA